jgi:hypothetical protein
VSPNDCMVIPKAAVSEVCPKPPVQHFGEPRFKRCRLPWTWDDLYAGHYNGTITYYQGWLGKLRVTGRFETWVCLKGAFPSLLFPPSSFLFFPSPRSIPLPS